MGYTSHAYSCYEHRQRAREVDLDPHSDYIQGSGLVPERAMELEQKPNVAYNQMKAATWS